jgi:hypothetical protein
VYFYYELIKLLDANNSDKYTLINLGFIIIDIIKKEYSDDETSLLEDNVYSLSLSSNKERKRS